jgi:hypothetical protein
MMDNVQKHGSCVERDVYIYLQAIEKERTENGKEKESYRYSV